MVNEKGAPVGLIEESDVVICFNFRTDRLRQTTIAFTQKNMPKKKKRGFIQLLILSAHSEMTIN